MIRIRNASEKTLPRKTRATLAQLRSYLNAFMHRIYQTDDPNCPKCGLSPHTTDNLFECQANPTTLTTRILWEDPPAAADFLGLPSGWEVDELDDND